MVSKVPFSFQHQDRELSAWGAMSGTRRREVRFLSEPGWCGSLVGRSREQPQRSPRELWFRRGWLSTAVAPTTASGQRDSRGHNQFQANSPGSRDGPPSLLFHPCMGPPSFLIAQAGSVPSLSCLQPLLQAP